MLISMGARITGPARLEIEGVGSLRPTQHAVVPSAWPRAWAFAAAATRGDVEVVGARGET